LIRIIYEYFKFIKKPFGTILVSKESMKKEILLIEDNEDMNMIITNLLKSKGYNIDSVFTGKEAYTYLNKKDYDLIIVDYQLPDINGLQIIEQFKDHISDVSKIMISAFGNEKLRKEAERLNTLFIDKPFKNEELLTIISKVVN